MRRYSLIMIGALLIVLLYATASFAAGPDFFKELADKYSTPKIDSFNDMNPFNSYFKNNLEKVSLANGSLSIDATDFILPGRGGFDLTVKRIYNSDVAQRDKILEKSRNIQMTIPVSTFGTGWSLNIAWIEFHVKDKKTETYLHLPENQQIKIEFKDNEFVYHYGIHFVLKDIPSENIYKLIMKNGVTYVFDREGKLSYQLDPSGKNRISYYYNGKEISRIVDSVGRQINFTYKSVGSYRLIGSIEAGGRVVNYNYKSSGVLNEVYDPLNRKTTYNYQTSSLNAGTEIWWTCYELDSDDGEHFDIDYSLDILNEIIYPTKTSSNYTYTFLNQYSHQEWVEESDYVGIDFSVQSTFYGSKILVQEHKIGDRIEKYNYTMNDEYGSMKNGTYTPNYTHMIESTYTSGDKYRCEGYSHIVKTGDEYDITEEPNPDQYIGTVAHVLINDLEKVYYRYDYATQTINKEEHEQEEVNYSISRTHDEWGNVLSFKYFSDFVDLEENYTYHPHSTIKSLPESKAVKNYNPVNNTSTAVTTVYDYDELLGKPETISVSDGAKTWLTKLSYYENGNLKTRAEPNQLVTEYFYDDSYQAFPVKKIVYAVKDADDNLFDIITQYGYNYFGLKDWEMDPRGYVTRYKYDNLDRVTKIILPDDNDVPYTLPTGQDPTGNPCREYKFDDAQNTCEFYNENRQKVLLTFDGLGKLVRKTQYLTGGRYDGITEAATIYNRDEYGRITSVIDPRGVITSVSDDYTTWYQYDRVDRVKKVIFPEEIPGDQSSYVTINYGPCYDGNGIEIIDENGGEIQLVNDWLGRLIDVYQDCIFNNTTETYEWHFTYDSLGNNVRSGDPLLRETVQEFNSQNCLVRIINPTVSNSVAIPGTKDKNTLRTPGSVTPVITYTYDEMGRHSSETSANGNSVSDPGNYTVNYDYDQLGRLIKVTTKATKKDLASGQDTLTTSVTKHYYDPNGNQIETRIVDPNDSTKDKVWRRTYSARCYLLSEQDPEGNTTHYRYDPMGNKIAAIDPRNTAAAPVTWYSIIGSEVVLDDPRSDKSYTTWFLYDDFNRLYRTVQPDGTPPGNPFISSGIDYDNPYSELSYDLTSNKTAERDANGVVTTYEYYSRNWLKSISSSEGIQQTYRYDKVGNQTEIHTRTRDNTFYIVKKEYDSLNRLRRTIYPDSRSETYDYDALGRMTGKTVNGKTTEYFYNEAGWLIGVKDPMSNQTQYRYDPNGNQVAVIAPNDLFTIKCYDECNRLIESIDSLGFSTKYNYDLAGNREAMLDPRGTLWKYTYLGNNLLQQFDLIGADQSTLTFNYTYDPAGNRTAVSDDSSIANSILYNVDALNIVNSIERKFNGGTYRTEYGYDKAGYLTSIKYPEAESSLIYQYDNLNRLNGITEFTNTGGITYYPDGALKSIANLNGVTASFNFDDNNRWLNDLRVNTGSADLLSYNFTYDQFGNIINIYNGVINKNAVFTYDNNNQLMSAKMPVKYEGEASGTHGIIQADYLGDQSFDFPDDTGATVSLDYNASSIGFDFGIGNEPVIKKIRLAPDSSHQNHRLTRNAFDLYISNDNFTYTAIADGQWEYSGENDGSVVFTFTSPITARFIKIHVKCDERTAENGPDNQAQFLNTLAGIIRVSVEFGSRSEEYQYDGSGNRLSSKIVLPARIDSYNSLYYANSNRLKTDGKYAYAYDSTGNLIAKGDKYNIDGDDVTFTASGEGVEYWEYQYDLINRLSKVFKNGILVSEYGYDPEGNRVVKKAGDRTIHYVFEGTEPIFEKRTNDGEIRSYVYAARKLLARVDGKIGDPEANKYWYHTDQVGSVKAVTDIQGNVVWKANYTPFGIQVGMEAEAGFEESHGFTGKEYDADIGLYYFNARWYDPELGRFISEDPTADPNNPNLYAYSRNNPLRFIDPSGLWTYEVDLETGDLIAIAELNDILSEMEFYYDTIATDNNWRNPDIIHEGDMFTVYQLDEEEIMRRTEIFEEQMKEFDPNKKTDHELRTQLHDYANVYSIWARKQETTAKEALASIMGYGAYLRNYQDMDAYVIDISLVIAGVERMEVQGLTRAITIENTQYLVPFFGASGFKVENALNSTDHQARHFAGYLLAVKEVGIRAPLGSYRRERGQEDEVQDINLAWAAWHFWETYSYRDNPRIASCGMAYGVYPLQGADDWIRRNL